MASKKTGSATVNIDAFQSLASFGQKTPITLNDQLLLAQSQSQAKPQATPRLQSHVIHNEDFDSFAGVEAQIHNLTNTALQTRLKTDAVRGIGDTTINTVNLLSDYSNHPLDINSINTRSKENTDIFDFDYLGQINCNTNNHKVLLHADDDDVLGPLGLAVTKNDLSTELDGQDKNKNEKSIDAFDQKINVIDVQSHQTEFEAKIDTLLNMGFDYDSAFAALNQARGNIHTAVSALVKKSIHADDSSVEILAQKYDSLDKNTTDSKSSVTHMASAFSASLFKNAKEALAYSRKKAEQVIDMATTSKAGGCNNVFFESEDDWSKPMYKDNSNSTMSVKSAVPIIAAIGSNRASSDFLTPSSKPLDLTKISLENTDDQAFDRLVSSQPLNNLLHGTNAIKSVDVPHTQSNKQLLNTESSSSINIEIGSKIMKKSDVVASTEQIEISNRLRLQGNDHFKKGQFGDAEQVYTQAIKSLPRYHTLILPLLNNRAACRLKNGDYKGAVVDCDTLLHQSPLDLKCLFRRACAFEELERWSNAREDYRVIMTIDYNFTGVSLGLSRCNQALQPRQAIQSNARSTPLKNRIVNSGDSELVQAAINQAVRKLKSVNDRLEEEEDQKFALSDLVSARVTSINQIDRWKYGKEDSIRALLSSLDLILWPQSGWKSVPLSELITPAQVKVKYIRAVSKVHPDKVVIVY